MEPRQQEGPQPRWTLVSWLESQRLCLAARHLPQETPCLSPAHMWFPEATHAAEGLTATTSVAAQHRTQLPSVINHGPTAEILMIVNNAGGKHLCVSGFSPFFQAIPGAVSLSGIRGLRYGPLVGGLGTTLAYSWRGGVGAVPGSCPFLRSLRSLWVFKADLTQGVLYDTGNIHSSHHLLQCFPHLCFPKSLFYLFPFIFFANACTQ